MAVATLPAAGEAAQITDCRIFAAQSVLIGIASNISGLVCSGNSVVGDARLGGQSTVIGDVRAGDDVVLNNGATVTGTVTNPGNFLLGGGASVGAHIQGTPDLPTLMPATMFSAGGQTYGVANGGTLTLAPGSYGKVTLGGGGKLNLSAGDYYFTSLGAGNGLDLNIALGGGDIRIFSEGAIRFGNMDVFVTGGDASNIYFETHQVGVNAFQAGAGTDVLGTVFAPYGNIHLGSGTGGGSFQGYLWAGGEVNIEHGVIGTGLAPVPEPATIVFFGIGLAGLGAGSAWRNRRRVRSSLREGRSSARP